MSEHGSRDTVAGGSGADHVDTPAHAALTFTSDWHTPHVPLWRELLAPLVGKPCDALEVGSYEGRSACWLLANVLTHPDARLTCVDTFEDAEVAVRFHANLAAEVRAGRCAPHSGPSSYHLSAMLGRRYPGLPVFDLVYIDGSHAAEDVLLDATLGLELVRVGGLLAFDDYVWGGGDGPRRAVDALVHCNAARLEALHLGTQAWFRRVR